VYRWLSNLAIIAPFWARTDQYLAFKGGISKVFYHVYEKSRQNTFQTDTILTMASQHVQSYDHSGKFASFNATWVLVVTWVGICPFVDYPENYYYNNENSTELNCRWVSIYFTTVNPFYLFYFILFNPFSYLSMVKLKKRKEMQQGRIRKKHRTTRVIHSNK